MYSVLWGILIVVFLIMEVMTAISLVSIWFCAGALVALLLSLINAPLVLQIIAFLVVSTVTILAVKPLADKHLRYTKTNVDSIIGQECKVVEEISNINNTGRISVNGISWKAKAVEDKIIKENTLVKIIKIEGVSAIVE